MRYCSGLSGPSGSRNPLLKRDDLDADGKRIYDELAGGPGKSVTPTISALSWRAGKAGL
jgi:hypothetical protein